MVVQLVKYLDRVRTATATVREQERERERESDIVVVVVIVMTVGKLHRFRCFYGVVAVDLRSAGVANNTGGNKCLFIAANWRLMFRWHYSSSAMYCT